MKYKGQVVIKSTDSDVLDLAGTVIVEAGYTCKIVSECRDFISELSGRDAGMGIVDLDTAADHCIQELADAHRARPALPLVAISSDRSLVLGRKLYGLKIFYNLLKPISRQELREVIHAGFGKEDETGWRYRTKIRDVQWYRENIPCMDVCPVHTDSGRYVQLIAEGKFREAYLVSRSPNPLASTCGKICAAFCEDACRRSKLDCAVTIRALKRFVTAQYGPESLSPETFRDLFNVQDPGNQHPWNIPSLRNAKVGNAKQVAVVGGGPAGLACAHDLTLMGFKVTIFEASDSCGGAMQLCIPEYRLPRDLLNKEIESIIDMGIELKLNTPISSTFGIQALRKAGFEAIFLATGALCGTLLDIPGSDLKGVYSAIDYLLNLKKKQPMITGKKVIIVGGGKVALDIARTAWRLITDESLLEEPDWEVLDAARAALQAGARPLIAYPESVAEMAAAQTIQGQEEISELKKEGIEMLDHRLPKRFIGRDGRVCGVVFDKVSKCIMDDGRFDPQIIPDSEETFEADSVIMAVGQVPDTSYLTPEDGLATNSRGFIKVNPQTMSSTLSGVFAGGDAAFGSRSVIEAVSNGKAAALAIAEYLNGAPLRKKTCIEFQEIPAREYFMAAGYEKIRRMPAPTIPLEKRVGIEEIELDFTREQAREQAKRCLKCHIETIYDSAKCVLCGRCVDICPQSCLKLVPFRDVHVEGEDKEDLAGRLGYAEENTLCAMIKDDEKCIRCGLCALRCPTGAMTTERFSFVEKYQEASAIE